MENKILSNYKDGLLASNKIYSNNCSVFFELINFYQQVLSEKNPNLNKLIEVQNNAIEENVGLFKKHSFKQ